MSRRIIRVVLAGALLAALGTGCSAEAGAEQGAGSGWRQLPDAPLGTRESTVLVAVGDRVLVVGGEEFSCPPNADCTASEEPLFDDGAVYDAATDSWSAAAPAPFGVRAEQHATAALDGTAFLLTRCASGPACDAPQRLLSYRLADDRWTDHGPVPGPALDPRRIVPLDRTLLVHSAGDESGETPDLVFDPANSTWDELPDDPLPPTADRFVVRAGDQLVLAGSPSAALGSGDGATLVARFDLARRVWSLLPDAPGRGSLLLPTDRGPLLDGYSSGSPGWLLDPGTWTWSELSAPPPEHGLVYGVLDRDRAVYDLPLGIDWLSEAAPVRIYDSAAGVLRAVPPPPRSEGVYGDAGTALGRDLFLFGGQRYSDDGSRTGGGAWSWTAPAG